MNLKRKFFTEKNPSSLLMYNVVSFRSKTTMWLHLSKLSPVSCRPRGVFALFRRRRTSTLVTHIVKTETEERWWWQKNDVKVLELLVKKLTEKFFVRWRLVLFSILFIIRQLPIFGQIILYRIYCIKILARRMVRAPSSSLITNLIRDN